MDIRQSENFASYMEKIGWQVEKFDGGQIFIKKIPPLGNFIKILRPEKQIPKEILDQIARRHNAFTLQVNYSPTKTLEIDLTPPLEQIITQMTKEARYEIRKAQANNVLVRSSSDIELFANMWEKNAFRRGFWLPFKKEIKSVYQAFGENAYLLLGYLSNPGHLKKPLAGALILVSGKTASYFHAASSQQGRQLSAPSVIVWEAIKLAKEKGCRVFDFEGIYDERFPIKSWKGFTHFKKSFGGKEVEYSKTYTYPYRPRFFRWLNIAW